MIKLLKNAFVGTHELRRNLTKILADLEREGQEVVITQQGKPAAIIMDVEKYLEIQEALKEFSDPEYVAALLEANREIEEGKGIPAEEVFRERGL
ncbi:MAG: type II toxin-antitoxin system Phd/YefM family antitoxin [Chloroflexi bacterium]|nr:type II toxin-antitoxin system Phd/YefM family antitoxin [Chloroflexota bacterium]